MIQSEPTLNLDSSVVPQLGQHIFERLAYLDCNEIAHETEITLNCPGKGGTNLVSMSRAKHTLTNPSISLMFSGPHSQQTSANHETYTGYQEKYC